MKKETFQNKLIFILLFLLFLIGIFLRFANFEKYVIFLGDQGRDAIIFKRIITLEHPTAVGPPSSIGGVYLGPFFYYFIAPWLLLFNFDPVGPAFGVGIFSCLYILINFFTVKKILNEKIAFISTILTAFSVTLINFSRFSWNPNLLPLFSLLTVFFAYQAYQTKNSWYYFLTGMMAALAMQLHYLVLLILPPLILYFFIIDKKQKKSNIDVKKLLLSIFTFVLFSSPLIFFDLRHNFLNTRNLIALFNQSGNFSQNKSISLLMIFNKLTQSSFNLKISLVISSLLLISMVIFYCYFLIKKKNNIHLFFLIIFFYIFGVSFYRELKSAHYFGAIYPFFFIIISYFLSLLQGKKVIITLCLIFIFIYTNSLGYYFLKNVVTSQIDKAKKVAKVIEINNKLKEYSLISLPESSSEAQYRYFLEAWGHQPIDREIRKRTDELFITCEQPCQTIGNPQWDVALFAPTKVDQSWKVENVTIYKLSH